MSPISEATHQWPPISEVFMSDVSSETVELVIDFACHVPLYALVGKQNVLDVLDFAEAGDISAVKDEYR